LFRLRGYLPFDASNVGEILKKTYIQDAPMDDEHWDKISPEGKYFDILKIINLKRQRFVK